MVGLAILFVAAQGLGAPPPHPTPTPRIGTGMLPVSKTTQPPPHGRSLGAIARDLKLRFPSQKPKVITNESLKELSAGAELTTALPPPASASSSTSVSAEEKQLADKKGYWQQRYFAAQEELTSLEAEEKRLATEAARLEREFYARDDPYQRDNVIKPEWDDTVAKLRDVQKRLDGARTAPESIANDARRDGALPGWFREAAPPRQTPRASERQ